MNSGPKHSDSSATQRLPAAALRPGAQGLPSPAPAPLAKVVVRLHVPEAHQRRLADLQAAFAQACNHIARMAAQSNCWNRVGLHHLVYRSVREQFADLGSQMACNAIYSVSRAARRLFQDPASPWHAQRAAKQPLAAMRFQPTAPVYFDRHTLSLKQGQLSLFTLDGRMRFQINVPQEVEDRFARDKLREVVLLHDKDGYALRFVFGPLPEHPQPDPEEPDLMVELEPPPGPGQAPNALQEAL